MAHDHPYQLQVPKPKYDCLLYDVDDTLYPLSSRLTEQCCQNIEEYMINKLGMDENEVHTINFQLYKDYGTTLAGLKALGYEFDADDFHSYIHGRLPYENLRPDPALKNLINSLPIRKVAFSNANEAHVAKVLGRLGLEDCFEGIICYETLNPNDKTNTSHEITDTDSSEDCSKLPKSPVICKPNANAFVEACKIAKIDPKTTLFFEDNLRNLQTAKQLGFHTVLIGSSHRAQGVDYALESIQNIREALPDLWETHTTENIHYPEPMAIETCVKA